MVQRLMMDLSLEHEDAEELAARVTRSARAA
jgi:hypothetical protein